MDSLTGSHICHLSFPLSIVWATRRFWCCFVFVEWSFFLSLLFLPMSCNLRWSFSLPLSTREKTTKTSSSWKSTTKTTKRTRRRTPMEYTFKKAPSQRQHQLHPSNVHWMECVPYSPCVCVIERSDCEYFSSFALSILIWLWLQKINFYPSSSSSSEHLLTTTMVVFS